MVVDFWNAFVKVHANLLFLGIDKVNARALDVLAIFSILFLPPPPHFRESWDQRPAQNNKALKEVSVMMQEGGCFLGHCQMNL